MAYKICLLSYEESIYSLYFMICSLVLRLIFLHNYMLTVWLLVQLGLQWGCRFTCICCLRSRFGMFNLKVDASWGLEWFTVCLYILLFQDMMSSLGTFVAWFLGSMLTKTFPHGSKLAYDIYLF